MGGQSGLIQNQEKKDNSLQVYYDPETGQYFRYKDTDPAEAWFKNMFNIPIPDNNKMYLSNPYTSNLNRIPQTIASPYPSTDALFPSLNAGLLDNLLQGSQPTGAMYGAGKYLTGTNLLSMPTTTTSESKGK